MIKFNRFKYPGGRNESLKDFDPDYSAGFPVKEQAATELETCKRRLAELQNLLYSQNQYSLLIILQGMDASGKDGIIKHVMSGVNPQGIKNRSFSTPSAEEYSHDYMWRCIRELPERGQIGIFNRSYYEEVLITRIHPEFLVKQRLPRLPETPEEFSHFWKTRYQDINNFEKYLTNNGYIILKFMLNIGYEEQRTRFLSRINNPAKNWKFKVDDLRERQYWDEYIQVYQDMFNQTSTHYAPWYIIPANKKRTSRLIICSIINTMLESLDLHYPEVPEPQKIELQVAKEVFESEIHDEIINPAQ
ncbi:MAG: polyphosphate kinase 2 family protein [Bacteroidetes bacterium]|nr:polyphosphate kinase 2 family protein [Bacteroidota bacterium]MBU1717796.1 polyphosphate kinase 2 family protein [Bacteroidota bacterium]